MLSNVEAFNTLDEAAAAAATESFPTCQIILHSTSMVLVVLLRCAVLYCDESSCRKKDIILVSISLITLIFMLMFMLMRTLCD
jgi:hypothetical protein